MSAWFGVRLQPDKNTSDTAYKTFFFSDPDFEPLHG